jgi:hypothetical protein
MKEPCTEGLASHGDPESCVGIRKEVCEALTGERIGEVLSREINLRGADRVKRTGRPHSGGRHGEPGGRPRVVGDPLHVRTLLEREPGDPMTAHATMVGRGSRRED